MRAVFRPSGRALWLTALKEKSHFRWANTIRTYLTTPDLNLRLIALPAYSPDFNADEAIWDWAREEVTANSCLGTKAKVQEKVSQFFNWLKSSNVAGPSCKREPMRSLANTFNSFRKLTM